MKDGGKVAFHGIGTDGFGAVGDFEADSKPEGVSLTLTQGAAVPVPQKK